MTSEVVTFPTPEEEQARRLLALIKQRASQPEAERRLWLPGDTQKFGIEEARLWELYEAEVREREKHQREELAVQREAERKAERKAEQSQRKAERKQKQEEREQEREERREEQEERRERREKAAERREAAKRERALTTIMTMPTDGRDAALRSLAIQLGEDYAALHTEFETRVEEERERIRHGKVEPWPEPVETRALLDELVVQIERYLVLPHPEARAAMVLWICFAWVHDIATFSPILALTSADADAGKSTASQIIAKLTPRPHLLSEPSAASVYHIVDDEQPTLIVDDADRLLARSPNLAHIVNTAWQRGAKVSRYDSRARRNIYYDVFYPKVLNGIDLLLHLRPATRTRCITINLKPKLPTEKVTSFRFADNDEQFVTLQRKLRRWSKDNKVRSSRPTRPCPKATAQNSQTAWKRTLCCCLPSLIWLARSGGSRRGTQRSS